MLNYVCSGNPVQGPTSSVTEIYKFTDGYRQVAGVTKYINPQTNQLINTQSEFSNHYFVTKNIDGTTDDPNNIRADYADNVYINNHWVDVSDYFDSGYSNNPSGTGYYYLLGEFPHFRSGNLCTWGIIFATHISNNMRPEHLDLNGQGTGTGGYVAHDISLNSDADDWQECVETDAEPMFSS